MSQNANALENEDAGTGAERRSGQRHMTVFKVARISGSNTDDLCLIRNISAHGVMVETLLPLHEGDHVTIEIRSDKHLDGTVRWSREGAAGIQFDHPINVNQTLGKDAQGRSLERARAPRFTRSAKANVRCERQLLSASISNISLSGAHVLADYTDGLHPSDHVTITIDGLGAIGGAIRWLDADGIGIQFDRPLPFRQFEYWLQRRDHPHRKHGTVHDTEPRPGFSAYPLPSSLPSGTR